MQKRVRCNAFSNVAHFPWCSQQTELWKTCFLQLLLLWAGIVLSLINLLRVCSIGPRRAFTQVGLIV